MNMSYCRFQNTKNDLADCLDHIDETVSKDETKARIALVKIARDIVDAADNGDIPSVEAEEDEGE